MKSGKIALFPVGWPAALSGAMVREVKARVRRYSKERSCASL